MLGENVGAPPYAGGDVVAADRERGGRAGCDAGDERLRLAAADGDTAVGERDRTGRCPGRRSHGRCERHGLTELRRVEVRNDRRGCRVEADDLREDRRCAGGERLVTVEAGGDRVRSHRERRCRVRRLVVGADGSSAQLDGTVVERDRPAGRVGRARTVALHRCCERDGCAGERRRAGRRDRRRGLLRRRRRERPVAFHQRCAQRPAHAEQENDESRRMCGEELPLPVCSFQRSRAADRFGPAARDVVAALTSSARSGPRLSRFRGRGRPAEHRTTVTSVPWRADRRGAG